MPRLFYSGGPIAGLSLLLLLSPPWAVQQVAQGFQLQPYTAVSAARAVRGERRIFTGPESAGQRLYAIPDSPQGGAGRKEFETRGSPRKGDNGNGRPKAVKGGSSGPPAPREKPQYVGPAAQYNPREAAYLAALAADREQCYMHKWLEQWRQLAKPTSQEMALAMLLSSVACREALALDYALGQLKAESGPLKLKARQRVILRVGLAAYRYCTRIPLHATVDSTVELAKKFGGGQAFGGFCNAVLRKLPPDPRFDNEDRMSRREQAKATGDEVAQGVGGEANMRHLPVCEVTDEASLSIATSHPPFLVSLLVKDLGSLDAARKVLEAGNSFPPTMARTRPGQSDPSVEGGEVPKGARLCEALPSSLTGGPLPYSLYTLPRGPSARTLSSTGAWYVTNGTPASLIGRLTQSLASRQQIAAPTGLTKRVVKVLDLCAAPGGKGLAVLDTFAKLEQEGEENVDVEVTFNDVSEEKLELVLENLRKFNLQGSSKVKLCMGDGASLKGAKGGYDVVIVDAPCSNTGVLARRPEARWRLRNDDLLFELEATQRGLLEHAVSLLSPDNPRAEVWYMTCSILKREDEDMAAHACETLGLELVPGLSMKVLPGEVEGFDGGYAACLRKKQ